MKRFMVFAFNHEESDGGLNDVNNSYDTLPIAVNQAKLLYDTDVVQIFDRYKGEIIDISLYILHRHKTGTKNYLITHKQ